MVMKIPFLRSSALFLLSGLVILVSILSQLDNITTGEIYYTVGQFVCFDLKSSHITSVQISNSGHIVAGFVLSILALLSIRRWWVLPLLLLFFVGIEVAQLFSTDRQSSWLDILRGWGGIGLAWSIITTVKWVLSKTGNAKEVGDI